MKRWLNEEAAVVAGQAAEAVERARPQQIGLPQ
jgi:hypothetical protein